MAEIDKTLFSYMGSKKTISDWVIGNFPVNYSKMRYVEVCGGSAQILLNKQPSEVEIYNDINSHLTNFFEVIRNQKDEFLEQLRQCVVSEDLYNYFYKNIDKSFSNVERAVRYFYIMSYCHKGKYNGGFSVIADSNYIHKFETKEQTIDWVSKRIKNVLITNKSYEKIITANNTEDTLLYVDFPYVSTENYYHVEGNEKPFTRQDHIIARDLLKAHKGIFVVSYEADAFVSDLYSEFTILGKNKYRPGKGKEVEEVLVTNRRVTNELFDNSRNSITQYNQTITQGGLF